MTEREIDAIVAIGKSEDKAEKIFQKRLNKVKNKGWKPIGLKSLIKNTDDKNKSVYMVYQVIHRK